MNTEKEKYKKFMFNRRFDETEDEIAVAEAEINEIIGSNDDDNSEIEQIINIEKPEIKIEPVYVPPTYTQEQLDEEIQKAKQIGIDLGKKEAEESIAKLEASALEIIEKQITNVKNILDEQTINTENNFITLCSLLVKKLMPEMEKKGGFLEIEKILKDYFPRLNKEPVIKIIVNPKQTPALKEKITNIIKKTSFLGKIVIQNNEELNLSDLQIEWDKGGISRDVNSLMSEVQNILQMYVGDDKNDDDNGEING